MVDLDPANYDTMQEYASEIYKADDLVDPIINMLARGLMAGVHDSSTEDIFDDHVTVHYDENQTIHYDEETGRWRDL